METSKDQYTDMQEQSLSTQETGLSLELSGLLKLNKSDIKQGVSRMKHRVEEGEVNALDALILAKKGQEAYKQMEEAVRPLAEDHSYGKEYVKHGVTVEEANIGAKWDYKPCKDPLLESLLLRVKERQQYLQTIKTATKIEFMDETTGEVTEHEIYPAFKSSGRMGLKLTVK